MRDFTPEIQILRNKLISKIEKKFQAYGFDPIETPIVEKWETLAGKYGEEAEKRLIWRFKLPYSNKQFGLRYDLTVPLARYVARFRPRLPFKCYHIGRVFRYEDPQKGRYREFWQCDADIIGSNSFLADAEIIQLVSDILEDLGLKNYTIRVNDRRILFGIFQKKLKIKGKKIFEVFRIIDKLDKIGKQKVLAQLSEYLNKQKLKQVDEMLVKQATNSEIINWLLSFEIPEVKQAAKFLEQLLQILKRRKIKIDISLVRGLDYYTGLIYEAVVSKPKIGSVSGGGRYDELIGMFTKTKTPAVGGSIGIERIIDAGLELGILKAEQKTYTKAGIVYLLDSNLKKVWGIAQKVREKGISLFFPPSPYKNILEGIRDLSKRGIRYALILGPKEIKTSKPTLQDLQTKERQQLSLEEAIKKLS